MQTVIDVKENQMVHLKSSSGDNSNNLHVGTVDHVDGEFIKLKRRDSKDGRHHWIPISWVSDVEGDIVIIDKSEAEFKKGLLDFKPQLS